MPMTLKNPNMAPIGGYRFLQPETGFGQGMVWWDKRTICRDVLDNRLGNPRFGLSTNPDDIWNDVQQQNCLRMMSIKGGSTYVNQNAPAAIPKVQAPVRHQPVAGASAKLAAGIETLSAWLGKGGKPVAQELATKRAEVCVTCPQNGDGDLSRYFTVPAAALIKKQLERRNQMKLSTPHDSKLGICKACSCPLSLKEWTPLVDIVEHMSNEVKAALDPRCWILSEK